MCLNCLTNECTRCLLPEGLRGGWGCVGVGCVGVGLGCVGGGGAWGVRLRGGWGCVGVGSGTVRPNFVVCAEAGAFKRFHIFAIALETTATVRFRSKLWLRPEIWKDPNRLQRTEPRPYFLKSQYRAVYGGMRTYTCSSNWWQPTRHNAYKSDLHSK